MAHLSIKLTFINWLEITKAHGPGIILGITTGLVGFALVTLCRHYFNLPFLTLGLTNIGILTIVLLVLWLFPAKIIKSDQREFLYKLITKRFKKPVCPPKIPIQNAWIN
jgi:hypothetical protein